VSIIGKKSVMIVVTMLTLGTIFLSACKKEATVQVIARGASIKGANGLFFDKNDRLYIASAFAREIVVMDPDSGKIFERIGPDRGVDTPDDLIFGPDGSLYWTEYFTGEVGKLTPEGKKVTIAQDLIAVNPITFSNDGRLFVSRVGPNVEGLYELDPYGAKPPRPVNKDVATLNAFDFGPDGKLYGPLMKSAKVVSIDVDSGLINTVAEGFEGPAAVKFDKQGRLFALDNTLGKVFLINPTSGQKTEYASIEQGLDNLAFDSRGRMFTSNAITGAIYEVLADGSVRTVSPGGMTSVGGIAAISLNDSELVYVPTIFGIFGFDGATGKQRSFVQALPLTTSLMPTYTLSPDGAQLITSSFIENMVQVWDPISNEILTEYGDLASPTNAIRFQGDIIVAEIGTNPPRVIRINAENPAERITLAEMQMPAGLAANEQNLWATDWATGTVVQIIKNRQQLTPPKVVVSGLKGPEGTAVAPDGSLLMVENLAGRLLSINPETGAVNSVAEQLELGIPGPPNNPIWILDGVAVGPSGAIYVGGDKANVVYRIQ
jgi:streptogramin lyase